MRRADRLFRLIEKLRPGRLLTARDLAEALEVSERTIYRDIAHLVGSGVPIEGAAGVGYLMRPGYDLPPIMFTEEEIVALTVAARMLTTFGSSGMARGAASALDKITAILPDTVRRRAERVRVSALTSRPLTQETRRTIDTLEAAVEAVHRVRLSYVDEGGAATLRDVRPVGLWFWGQVWTLVGWCELRRDFRMFRVDRIREATDLGQYRPEPHQTLAAFQAAELALCGPRDGVARG